MQSMIDVEITGMTPLLIRRFGEDAEQGGPTRTVVVDRKTPRDEAEKAAYKADDGTYYFSSFAIPSAMGSAGINHKMRGSRRSLRFVVPSAVRMDSDTVTILNGTGGPATTFEVDARPVTIPATKGKVMRYRPRFEPWRAEFTLLLEEERLSVEMAHQLLVEAGHSIGIGDFRPEKRGPFGTFRVTRFKHDGTDEVKEA